MEQGRTVKLERPAWWVVLTGDVFCPDCAPTREAARVAAGQAGTDGRVVVQAVSQRRLDELEAVCVGCGRPLHRR